MYVVVHNRIAQILQSLQKQMRDRIYKYYVGLVGTF